MIPGSGHGSHPAATSHRCTHALCIPCAILLDPRSWRDLCHDRDPDRSERHSSQCAVRVLRPPAREVRRRRAHDRARGVIGSMAAAPTVIRRVYKENFLGHGAATSATIEHARLRENVTQMSSHREEPRGASRPGREADDGLRPRSLPRPGRVLASRCTAPQHGRRILDDARRRETSLRNAMKRLQQQLDLIAQLRGGERRDRPPHAVDPPDCRRSVRPDLAVRHPHLAVHARQRLPQGARSLRADRHGDLLRRRWRGELRRTLPLTRAWHGGASATSWSSATPIASSRSTATATPSTSIPDSSEAGTVDRHGRLDRLEHELASALRDPQRSRDSGTYVPVDPRIYILNYQWSNEAALLMQAPRRQGVQRLRSAASVFVGKRRAS